MTTHRTLQFEGFCLDLDKLCLQGLSGRVNLRRKSFEVLRYLVEHAGRVVTKEEVMQAVWPDVTVSDESLTQCISEVRHALADNSQRIIKTVPRRGYILDVPISSDGLPVAGPPFAAMASAEFDSPPCLALPDRPSITVLPFNNLSGHPDQEYFADGVVEDIIAALTRIKWLFVVARNSSFTYKGKSVDVRQVARDLGVRYVLEGSVRRAGDRVRITGQLIDATTGGNVWADRFDGSLSDIFDLQDDVTARVVGALAPTVRDAEINRARHKPTGNLTAYDCYLRALYFMHRGGKADSDEALAMIEAALRADPKFALAAGLGGMILSRRWSHGWADSAECQRMAMRLIETAEERAHDDPDICMMVAHTKGAFGGDPDHVERLYRRALEMNPNSAWSLTMWATYCARSGWHEEAMRSVVRAQRLSPRERFAFLYDAIVAVCFAMQGRHAEAIASLRRALQENPGWWYAWVTLCASCAASGRMEEALDALAQLTALRPGETLARVAADMYRFYPDRATAEFMIEGLRKAGLAA